MVKITTIIDADISHVDAIYKIERESFIDPWEKTSIKKEISLNKLARYRVLVDDERVIGFYGIWLVLDECHIMNIAILKKERSKGNGSIMLEDLIRIARENGAKEISLEVSTKNLNAIKLYEKYGFKIISTRENYYRKENADAYNMQLIFKE